MNNLLISYPQTNKWGTVYQVILNPQEGWFKIKNVKARRYVKEGACNNYRHLLHLAKAALKTLGVEFAKELLTNKPRGREVTLRLNSIPRKNKNVDKN